ncbi:uncharacterized protein LOC111402303 isoform X2 [Olea europaea var. sylvestris]|uniref:uncharacterized protein LOC111402303 isoform X2 n=1 Tax=Olea europaea var. sylvestris TaxID=158386 RepID=UPI000C1D4042|nr:uncharacterized protein LOC111402303 isoform X2 [Olea europaea var. sylvestris]
MTILYWTLLICCCLNMTKCLLFSRVIEMVQIWKRWVIIFLRKRLSVTMKKVVYFIFEGFNYKVDMYIRNSIISIRLQLELILSPRSFKLMSDSLLFKKSNGFSRGTSIYRGVTRHHQHGCWQAQLAKLQETRTSIKGHLVLKKKLLRRMM